MAGSVGIQMDKTYIIAEIAQGFEGDSGLCKRFVRAAKESGADAVKFQIFKASELCLPDYQYHELFKSLEFPESEWKEVVDLAKELGLDFYADVFGTESLGFLVSAGVSGVKIHSTDVKNVVLLEEIRKSGVKVLLACGGSSLDEIDKAVESLNRDRLVLMSGFQGEPNQYGDVELDKIKFLRDRFELPCGYADHIDANDSIAISLPAMAILFGATVIEKHLTFERDTLKLEDYISALNPDEFVKMVEEIRKVEQFPRTTTYEMSEREADYRKKAKKAILTARSISEGEKITRKDLTMLRTGQPVPKILDLTEVEDKVARVSIEKHKVITEDMIQ